MQFDRLASWLRVPAIALVSLFLISCGTGDGEESLTASVDDTAAAKKVLVFRDDFGGPVAGARPAGVGAMIPPAPLPAGNWVAETGYGTSGWGNDEWQLYTNSMDNLFTENGSLVIRARCATAPACGKRDGSITSAKIISKNRLNIRYGTIRARIKMPSGLGMWPAFWTLGSDIDARPWPDAGEIDIVEMHYYYSDIFTTHFSTHWSGPKYTPSNRPICASGTLSSLYADEEENCKTRNKTFDAPLTDGFHVYELDWNENRIVGKIDGIAYFEQAIDPAEMEEFLKNHYLILNVAVGGTLGGPFGPVMSAADWADADQTDMLVDWVEVYEKVPPKSATLIDESGNNLPYNRIVNSVEVGGAFVKSKLDSTAVPALVGNSVLELKYSNSVSENGGVTAGFSGAIFWLNNLNLSAFNRLTFSLDTSRFPGFDDIGLEFEDSRGNKVLVRTSAYAPLATSGNWKTYSIPLADFAPVDMNDLVAFGFFNPNDAGDNLIRGTLYVDNIVFSAEACTPSPAVDFDAIDYNPATRVAQVSVSDACKANKLVTLKVENASDEIYLGVKLDAAGNGSTFFGLIDPLSVCPTSDEKSYIALSPPLIATYSNSLNGQFYSATATAGVDAGAPGTALEGERLFFYATDPGQALAFVPDAPVPNSFNYSVFSSGSTLNGAFADATYNPSFQVLSGTGYGAEVAQIALINLSAGFAAGTDTFSFKFRNVGSPNNAVKVEFGVLGGAATAVTVSLADTSRSTALAGGWYQVSIPMTDFPNTANYNFIAMTSADPAPASGNPFYFLVTDINLRKAIGVVPAECADTVGPTAPTIAAPTPTVPAGDVVSIFSDAYTDVAGTDYNPFWGQATVTTIESIAGNDTLKYAGLNYQGTQFGSSQNLTAAGVDTLHLDFWTADATAVNVYLISPGAETAYALPISTEAWVSVDIPLSAFTGVDLSNAIQFKFDDNGTAEAATIFLDNLYFYNSVPSPTAGVYSETNTSPTVPYAEIIDAGVSFGGNPTPSDPNSTAVTPLDGSTVLAVDFQAGGSGYGGAIFNFGPAPVPPNPGAGEGQDVSAYTHLSFGIDTSAVGSFGDLVVQLEDGANVRNVFLSNYTPVSTTGNWSVYELPLADFGGVDFSNLTFLGFWNLSSTAGSVTITTGTIYLDDIHFTNDPTPPPPPPSTTTSGVYSETNTNPTVPYAEIIDAGVSFGGNPTPSDPNSTAVTPLDGTNVLAIDFQDTGAGYGGAIFNFGPAPVPPNPGAGEGQDVSAYTHLSFGIDTSAVGSFGDLVIQLEDGSAANNVFLSNYTPVSTTGNWSVYEIPLADFPAVDKTNLTFLGFWNLSSAVGSVAITTGVVYLDDIHFTNDPTPPPPPPATSKAGIYSETNTSPVISYVEIIDAGVSFGGNSTPSDQANTEVTPLDGTQVLKIDFVDSGQGYGGAIFNFGPSPVPPNPGAGEGQDVSAYTHLSLGIDTSAVAGYADLVVQLEDGANVRNVFLSNYTPVSTTGNWSVYELPLADFGGVDFSNLTFLGFWNLSSTAGSVTLVFGPIYLDDIHLIGPASAGGELTTNGDFEAGDLSGWALFPSASGVQEVVTANPNSGTYAGRINNTQLGSASIIKQANIGIGTAAVGQNATIAFSARGSFAAGGVAFAEFFEELSGGGVANSTLLGGAPLALDPDPDVWTDFSFVVPLTTDVSGGVTLQLTATTGGASGSAADVYYDDVSITVGP